MNKPAAKNVSDSFSQQPAQHSPRHQPDRVNMSVNESYETVRARPEQRQRNNSTGKRRVNYQVLEGEILKLEDQLNSCMASHQFSEAEKLKNRIKDLKTEVIVYKQKEIDTKNTIELKKLTHGQNEEIQAFTEDWDRRIAVYRQKAQIAEKEMKKKHEEDLQRLEEDLRGSLPTFVRTSPKILNLKKMIETLAYQKDFAQADELSLQCLALEEEEMKKADDQREKKMFFIMSQLAAKQRNELAGLKKRITTGYFDLIKLREAENQKFSNKLQMVRKTVESKQNHNANKFELLYRNYIPGERLQLVPRKRGTSVTPSFKNEAPQALNASVIEEPVSRSMIQSSTRKRTMTPVRTNFQDSYMSPIRSNKNQILTPISPGNRLVSQPNRAGKGL